MSNDPQEIFDDFNKVIEVYTLAHDYIQGLMACTTMEELLRRVPHGDLLHVLFEEQYGMIAEKYGEGAAESANYGWVSCKQSKA